jgi:fluoroquinolone resistance protein
MIEILSGSEYEQQEFKDFSLKHTSISQVEFHRCSFNRCNFSQSILIECRFYDCTFRACDLSLVKLNGSYVRDAKFIGCKLIRIIAIPGFTSCYAVSNHTLHCFV